MAAINKVPLPQNHLKMTSHPKLSYDHNAFLVLDLEASVDFYKQILLLDEVSTPFPADSFRWMDLGADQQLHLIRSDDVTDKNKGVHLAFKTSNFDAFLDHLRQKQINYSDWPGELHQVNLRPDGIRQVFFQDPDGYWIEINDAKY